MSSYCASAPSAPAATLQAVLTGEASNVRDATGVTGLPLMLAALGAIAWLGRRMS